MDVRRETWHDTYAYIYIYIYLKEPSIFESDQDNGFFSSVIYLIEFSCPWKGHHIVCVLCCVVLCVHFQLSNARKSLFLP